MILLQTIIFHPSKYQTLSNGNGGQPCGHGNQPPCAVPLTDYLFVLVLLGVVLAIKYLKKQTQ